MFLGPSLPGCRAHGYLRDAGERPPARPRLAACLRPPPPPFCLCYPPLCRSPPLQLRILLAIYECDPSSALPGYVVSASLAGWAGFQMATAVAVYQASPAVYVGDALALCFSITVSGAGGRSGGQWSGGQWSGGQWSGGGLTG